MSNYEEKLRQLLGTIDNITEATDMLDIICGRLEQNNWTEAVFYVMGSAKAKSITVIPKFKTARPSRKTLNALTIVGSALEEGMCMPPVYAASRMAHLRCWI